MTCVAYDLNLLLVMNCPVHPWPGNWVAIGCSVMYYAQAAHAFTVEIK